MKGDPADPVVSHSLCSRECWNFHASLNEFKAELLPTDPAVAVFAVRFPSDSRPGVTHEASLLVTEKESEDRYGNVVDVPSGLAWDCSCESFAFESKTCRHLVKAIHLHTLMGRMKRYQAERAAS